MTYATAPSKWVVLSLFSFLFFLLMAVHSDAATPKKIPVQSRPPIPLSGEFNGDLSRVPFVPQLEIRQIPEPKEPEPNRHKKIMPGSEPPNEGLINVIDAMPSPLQNFVGLDFNTWGGGWPPDTVGDVGPNHYIQAVNVAIGIYNKTGTQLAAFSYNTLWAGSGTSCEGHNSGDPTVVYDPQGDRFIVADFAWTSFVNGPYFECIAVSKTSDPVAGGWWLYAVRADDAAHPWLPDYPKMGIWPDGLYMGSNMFDILSAAGNATYEGARAYAFNLADLESGAALRSRVVDIPGTNNHFTVLPSNYRGTPPPAGRENFFAGESGSTFAWEIYKFHVDYDAGGSTFIGPTNVSQSSYTVADNSVPSPQNMLDSLADRMMMQVQYRNISGTESLWVNHTVKMGSTSTLPNGIQWAQLDVSGGTINTTPVQQQTFGNLSADNLDRWMGAIAVDKSGNMALGYSGSSSIKNPSVRYAGRLVTDPLGTLAQGEGTLILGTGSQSGTCGGTCTRWGDYSALTVDPTDDCTFWYTTEYYAANGLNWQTRIGSFKYPQCGISCPTITFTSSSVNPTCSGGATGSITVDSQTGGTGPYTYSDNNGGTYQASNVFVGLTAGTYNVIVKDANGCTSSATPITLTAPPAITFTTNTVSSTCPTSTDGSITVNATGGTGTLEYSDDNGGSFQASNVFAGLTAGTYNMVVRDANSCVTPATPVNLTSTNSLPSVTQDPASQTVASGSSATFTAAATGTPAPTVQWQISTNGGGTFTDIPGETSTTLTFVTAPADNGNQYRAVFTNTCGTTNSAAATLTVDTCLFCDDFEDATLSLQWNYSKPVWTEPAGGSLIGVGTGKKVVATATPAFAGCSTCYVESTMNSVAGNNSRIWMLGWYIDKKNDVELLMKQKTDKWILKERIHGHAKKVKATRVIDPNTFYRARITFNGTQFDVSIDGVFLMSLTAHGPHNGTVGFEVKSGTANFGEIIVN